MWAQSKENVLHEQQPKLVHRVGGVPWRKVEVGHAPHVVTHEDAAAVEVFLHGRTELHERIHDAGGACEIGRDRSQEGHHFLLLEAVVHGCLGGELVHADHGTVRPR